MCLFKRAVIENPPCYDTEAGARMKANEALADLNHMAANDNLFTATSVKRKAQLKIYELEGALVTAKLLAPCATIPVRKLSECLRLASQGVDVAHSDLRRLYNVHFKEPRIPPAVPRGAWVAQRAGTHLLSQQRL